MNEKEINTIIKKAKKLHKTLMEEINSGGKEKRRATNEELKQLENLANFCDKLKVSTETKGTPAYQKLEQKYNDLITLYSELEVRTEQFFKENSKKDKLKVELEKLHKAHEQLRDILLPLLEDKENDFKVTPKEVMLYQQIDPMSAMSFDSEKIMSDVLETSEKSYNTFLKKMQTKHQVHFNNIEMFKSSRQEPRFHTEDPMKMQEEIQRAEKEEVTQALDYTFLDFITFKILIDMLSRSAEVTKKGSGPSL